MGALRRPYETFLRVFEPAATHPGLDSEVLRVQRQEVEQKSLRAADRRLLTVPIDPIPARDESHILTLPPGTMDDDVLRVCPTQEQVRSWHALDALEEVWPESSINLVAPAAVRRRAAADRADWALGDGEARVFTRMSTWDIPLPWFIAVHSTEDAAQVADDKVRVHAPLIIAQARVEWAAEILLAKLPGEEVTTEVTELAAWLEYFDLDSVVELDYGGLGNLVWPDTSSDDVHEGIESLGEDDVAVAAASYHRFARRWQKIAGLARAS